jgi:hypothetical protein
MLQRMAVLAGEHAFAHLPNILSRCMDQSPRYEYFISTHDALSYEGNMLLLLRSCTNVYATAHPAACGVLPPHLLPPCATVPPPQTPLVPLVPPHAHC